VGVTPSMKKSSKDEVEPIQPNEVGEDVADARLRESELAAADMAMETDTNEVDGLGLQGLPGQNTPVTQDSPAVFIPTSNANEDVKVAVLDTRLNLNNVKSPLDTPGKGGSPNLGLSKRVTTLSRSATRLALQDSARRSETERRTVLHSSTGSHHDHSKPWYIIDPTSRFRKCWDGLVSCFVLWIAWSVPLEVGFEMDWMSSSSAYGFAYFLEAFFWLDICMNFFTGFQHGGRRL